MVRRIHGQDASLQGSVMQGVHAHCFRSTVEICRRAPETIFHTKDDFCIDATKAEDHGTAER